MAAHLTTGKVNLGLLRDSYRREFIECLDRCPGTKDLIWDEGLTGPFGLIAQYTLLKDHDVVKMNLLRLMMLPPTSSQAVVFIVRPKLELMEQVAQTLIQEDQKGGFHKEFNLIFVPRKSLLCEKKLKKMGVFETFSNIEEFNLELIPFDYDLLSMEMDSAFRECYLENDYTSLFYAARSLMTLQGLYGIIPNIYGKGDCAKQVVDMMLRMRREQGGREPQLTPQIDNLLIIDRNVDLLTPMLSQLTYEGLIDEIFGINCTNVKLPAEKFMTKEQLKDHTSDVPLEPKKIVLDSSDEHFADLRDKNIDAINSLVCKKLKLLSAQFDERHAANTLDKLKQFVSKLPHLTAVRQAVANHLSIVELIKSAISTDDFIDCHRTENDFINGLDTDKPNPFIEDCIAREVPLLKVLRLICTQVYCNNGLKQKVLDFYKREIIQTYGFQHLVTLTNLEKIGLLRTQGQKTYLTIRKSLRLIVDDVNEQNPTDIAHVYSGYAPLSIRLAQHLAQPGWRSITEVLKLLPGSTVEEVQQIPVALRKRRSSVTSNHSQKVTLVFFLGGITYAEIAALRFLAQQDDGNVGGTDYIIATTKLINGNSLLESVMENLEPAKVNPF
ncbi:sorting-associated 33A-like isoform X2 [Octopus vulgaris]|uniref:Sorting-associated 33A-like isoform X2 n=2 Tax=Octopus TaxID=6643 RepID=A0AA36C1N8_OCTVU|nr:vacuolar protein sorting-associated protein 33A [Octopus sinensis]CAI9744345.1 sorting-associated 33A-like isoform X2 [Octopus vulgaris]